MRKNMRKSLYLTVTALFSLGALCSLSGCIEGHLIPPFNPYGPGGHGASSFATGKMVNGIGMSGQLKPSLEQLRGLVFKHLDKDQNGQLVADEMLSSLSLADFDQDASGGLSDAEFAKAADELAVASVPVSESQVKISISSAWNNLERNFDGWVGTQELKTHVLGSNHASVTCGGYSTAVTDLFKPDQPPMQIQGVSDQCSAASPYQMPEPNPPVAAAEAQTDNPDKPSEPQTNVYPAIAYPVVEPGTRAFKPEAWSRLEQAVDTMVKRYLDEADADHNGKMYFAEFEAMHLRLLVATAPEQLLRSSFLVTMTRAQEQDMLQQLQ